MQTHVREDRRSDRVQSIIGGKDTILYFTRSSSSSIEVDHHSYGKGTIRSYDTDKKQE